VLAEMEKLGNINTAQILEDQATQDRITSLLTNFENSVSLLKKEVLDTLINSKLGDELLKLGTSFSTLFTQLFGDSETGTSGAAGKLSGAFDSFSESLVGENGTLTNMVKAIQAEVDTFTGFVKAGGDPMKYIKERIEDMLLGSVIGDSRDGIRKGGLLEKISNGFTAILDGAQAMIFEYMGFQQGTGQTIMQQLIEKVFGPATEGQGDMSVFQRIVDEISTGITNAFQSESFQTKMDAMVDSLQPIMEKMFARLMSTLNETFLGYFIDDDLTTTSAEKLQKATEGLQQALTDYKEAQNVGSFENFFLGTRTSADLGLRARVSEYEAAGGDMSQISLPEGFQRRVGTLRATGQTTEPKDTVAKIHQGERVLNPSEAGAVNDLPAAIKQLNTLTAQVRDLMAQSVQYQEKTARGIRKLGSDMIA